MKKFWPLLCLAAGLAICLATMLFGVFVIGLPGPDDPPAEVARQDLLMHVFGAGLLLGVLSILTGALAGIWRLLSRR